MVECPASLRRLGRLWLIPMHMSFKCDNCHLKFRASLLETLVFIDKLLILTQACCNLVLVLLIDLLCFDEVVVQIIDLQLKTLVLLSQLVIDLVASLWRSHR
jgi:hypothetical protein